MKPALMTTMPMRGVWAGLQNEALERAGEAERVDHRLEAQREAAEARGDLVAAEELTRAPEVKLGPATNAMERRAARQAEAVGRDYAPVTERGRAVHEARRAFMALREELRERVEAAREAYGTARGEGQDRVSAGLAAMRAALDKQRDAPEEGRSVGDRLRRMLGREAERPGAEGGRPDPDNVRAKLDAALGRVREQDVGPENGARFANQQAPERAPSPPTRDCKPRDTTRDSKKKPSGRVQRERDDGWES